MANPRSTSTKSSSDNTTAAADTSAPIAPVAPAAPEAVKIPEKDIDLLIEGVMNQEKRSAASARLKSQIETKLAELSNLQQAQAFLDGAGMAAPVATPVKRGRKPSTATSAAAAPSSSDGRTTQDHASWIMKAVGPGGRHEKSEIKAKLTVLGHEISDSGLSTYLNNMSKRGQLLQHKIGPRRSAYERNAKYTG